MWLSHTEGKLLTRSTDKYEWLEKRCGHNKVIAKVVGESGRDVIWKWLYCPTVIIACTSLFKVSLKEYWTDTQIVVNCKAKVHFEYEY